MVATVGDIVEGIINVAYKAIVEVYSGATVRRSATFVKSQIAG
jgi:hypothetical protein